ncbi:MAG TPA: UPF0182 family protein [Acidimicrobiales bacterium]|nr:UPF0182 family protein [Acidimicrobiales bacterium]
MLAFAIGLLFVALFSARGVAGVYTDYLWFDSLGFSSVMTGILGTKITLALGFAALFAAMLGINLVLARRLAPESRPAGPEEEALAGVHAVMDRRPVAVWAAIAVVSSLLVGAVAAGHWNDWLLFRNHVPFGVDDPLFDRDVGFYVFRLPFLTFVVDWLFGALLVLTILVALAHYVNGGLRASAPTLHVTRGVKAHLSSLLGVMALVRAIGYYFDRFELVSSNRGVVRGAGYTDVNVKLPATNLLIIVAIVAAALFFYNIRLRGFTLPVIAVGLWALVAVIAGAIFPAFIQRFRVEPAESVREARYIERNIAATRAAMGLDEVEVRPFAYDEELNAQDLENNAETIRNVRLWDPEVLRGTYQRLQEVRTFYRFTDVDVDRYTIDDELTQIVLSARELNPDSLPSDTWENRHLAFTHGYGAVLSPANAVTSDGQPDFLVRDIPPRGDVAIDQPRLYHGEGIGGFAIVNSGRDEIDYLREDGTPIANRYDGEGGVGIGSLPRRLAFALRFGDVNPVISGFMTGESRILYIRDVRERARTIAPFLHYDSDPYPVVLDGRIIWIIDAYTTTDRYPYAQEADTDRLRPGSDLGHDFNYVRNSVKVAIDAYDGDATFYLVDPSDPIAAAYAKAFPKLFTPAAEVPDALRAHFRYPEDLFRVQTNMWGRYHIGDAGEFYSQSDRWNIAQDPGTSGPLVTLAPDPDAEDPGPPREGRMDPYYLLTRLPGSPRTEFLILQPLVPFSEDDTRRELSAFMVAKSDPESYGKLEVFVMPRDRQVDGPAIVNARINQEPEVSQLITLLSRAGSEVVLGNLVIIPLEQSLIYIRPLYVQATGANAVPELKKVVVAFGSRIAIGDTLREALTTVFGAAPETLEEGPDPDTGPGTPSGSGGLSEEARRLFDDAARAFAEADAALRAGDPVEYARKTKEGRDAFEAARQAVASSTTTVPG